MVIEEALQIATANDNKPLIVTEDGKAVGSVTLEAMIAAIARPEKDASVILNIANHAIRIKLKGGFRAVLFLWGFRGGLSAH